MIHEITVWIQTNQEIVGSLILALGTIIGLFGWKVHKLALSLSGIILGFATGLLIHNVTDMPILSIIIAIAIAIGLTVLTFSVYYLSLAVLGAAIAVMIVLKINPDAILIAVGAAIAGAIAALILHRYVIIAGTSYLGSMMVASGLTNIVITRFETPQNFEQPFFWSINLVLFSLFFLFQWKRYGEKAKEEDEERRAKSQNDTNH